MVNIDGDGYNPSQLQHKETSEKKSTIQIVLVLGQPSINVKKRIKSCEMKA